MVLWTTTTSRTPSLIMSFKYLYIPASRDEPLRELSASKSGGLENDALRKYAEETFSATGSIDRVEQRNAVVAQLKGKGIDPSKIDEILDRGSGLNLTGAVEIITLAVPTILNKYESVSLYCDGNSAFKEGGKVPNERATAIARACGHSSLVIMGNCFIGRALDDESREWERLDFPEADLSLDATWVQAAAKSNAGKNLSSYSTSGALDAMQNANVAKKAAPEPAAVPASEFSDGELFVWTQGEDEVEVRMKLPGGLLSKHLSVQIANGALFVGRKGSKTPADAALEGVDKRFSAMTGTVPGAALAGAVNPSESTWSVAEEREGRMLTVTMAKAKRQNWPKLLLH